MRKLLMICPTRGRPKKVMEMLDSFYKTRDFAEIVFYVANDDPFLKDYERNLSEEWVVYGDRIPMVQIFNRFSQADLYDYYGEINDDHYIHSPHWDTAFCQAIDNAKGWGIAFGREDHTPYWQPSGSVISRKTIRAVGHYVTPLLEHLFVDRYFIDLYQPLGLLHKCDDYHIEHRHYQFGKGDNDDNYRSLYEDTANFSRQEALYHKWRNEEKDAEMAKLKQAMREEA